MAGLLGPSETGPRHLPVFSPPPQKAVTCTLHGGENLRFSEVVVASCGRDSSRRALLQVGVAPSLGKANTAQPSTLP